MLGVLFDIEDGSPSPVESFVSLTLDRQTWMI